MRRAFGNRGRAAGRPARTWMSVSPQWSLNLTATTATALLGLEAPTGGALTSDPPEDLTILRMVGSFNLALTGAGRWALALVVMDATWTPASVLRTDQDKRILWASLWDSTVTSTVAGFTQVAWEVPGTMVITATTVSAQPCDPRILTVDIAPKVKIAPGQTLYLVAYEEAGSATLGSASSNMRVLFQRSRRR